MVKLLAKPAFLQDGGAGGAAVEVVDEEIEIEGCFASEVKHNLPLPDIAAFGEESPANAQVELAPDGLALLEGAPGRVEGGQGRRGPLLAKRLEGGFRLLQGRQPYFQLQFIPVRRPAAENFQGEGSFHQAHPSMIFG